LLGESCQVSPLREKQIFILYGLHSQPGVLTFIRVKGTSKLNPDMCPAQKTTWSWAQRRLLISWTRTPLAAVPFLVLP
jgi:hypothetical protein